MDHRGTVLLLDMMETFMFDGDRFSDPAALEGTYKSVGGSRLTAKDLEVVVRELTAHMGIQATDPVGIDCFPSIEDALRLLPSLHGCSSVEISRLGVVVGKHEVGVVSEDVSHVLWSLREKYRLGVVSNVWAHSGVFREALKRAGVADLFDVCVFSSDHGRVKPSQHLFGYALDRMSATSSEAVFVGDNLRCDIGGAAAIGMRTVWINRQGRRRERGAPVPTLEIQELRQLLDVSL